MHNRLLLLLLFITFSCHKSVDGVTPPFALTGIPGTYTGTLDQFTQGIVQKTTVPVTTTITATKEPSTFLFSSLFYTFNAVMTPTADKSAYTFVGTSTGARPTGITGTVGVAGFIFEAYTTTLGGATPIHLYGNGYK